MAQVERFVKIVKDQFPDDRLTYQKSVPTFHPESASEAAELFRLANQNRQPLFITGYGNNIDPVGDPFGELICVRTDRLNRLHEINLTDYYVEVGSGYPLRELNLAMQEQGLYLPHSSLPYVGSVGGALAVGLSSEYHQVDFPLKKYFIRTEIVTPTGEIITPGSVCFKSVSGYDVARLFAGSWGLLGLIVSATFRVMPNSAEAEYLPMKQKAVARTGLAEALSETNESTDAVYSRKIKAKLDPESVLPLVTPR
ncbi:MAG: FAD-binding oxidoreductase [bacterium]|nr:FAD-binding oxidoreductase [bacterium]